MKKTTSIFKAGAGQADITPVKGIQLSGDIGRKRPAEKIAERLHAKALVLEQGNKRCCILSLDLCILRGSLTEEIRRRAAEKFGFDPASVMVHVTQNHASPSLGDDIISDDYKGHIPEELAWLRGGDPRYYEPALQGVMQAIEKACAAVQPVTVQVGRGTDGRVGFNRRFVMRNGTGKTHPDLASPEIAYGIGLVDPEVAVMTFRGKSGKAIAAVLHYTCHPVHLFSQRTVIADWPGVWATGVQKLLGTQCVPLVLNGWCGDVHHNNHIDPDYKQDHKRAGRQLAETTAKILKRMENVASPTLAYQQTIVPLTYRTVTAKERTSAKQLLAKHPKPIWQDKSKTAVTWDWMYALSILDVLDQKKARPRYEFELQAFRIGNVLLIGAEGEPFVEGQIQIKLKSPAKYTFVAHLCNDYAGYVPTRAAFPYGGYETWTSDWSKLDPGALEEIVKASTKLLKKIF